MVFVLYHQKIDNYDKGREAAIIDIAQDFLLSYLEESRKRIPIKRWISERRECQRGSENKFDRGKMPVLIKPIRR